MRSLTIEQHFRSGGAGLGSAMWDGSFVLAEVLQRIKFIDATHAALNEMRHQEPAIGAGAADAAARARLQLPPLRLPRSAAHKAARARAAARAVGRASGQANLSVSLDGRDVPLAGMRVVELGAGLGLTSLVACLLGAEVVATDGDAAALQQARANFVRNIGTGANASLDAMGVSAQIHGSLGVGQSATSSSTSREPAQQDWLRCGDTTGDSANNRHGVPRRGNITTAVLRWGDERAARALRPPFDLVIAADVIYGYDREGDRTATFQALLSSLLQLTGPRSLVVLAYVPRRPTEKAFFSALWRHFEGAALERSALHPDFIHTKMELIVLRRRQA